jgi:general secretion pathway protein F
MPRFRYTALDANGKPTSGHLDETSAAAVADRFQRQGQFLLQAREVREGGRFLEFLHADLTQAAGLPRAAVAHLTRELSVMLLAGQDIDRALHFLVETSENRRARRILGNLRNHVRSGRSLAASLGEHPRVFSRLYISLVRAGEASGRLGATLAHLADLLERESRLAASITTALTYPALLLLAATGTVVVLLTKVLPQFTPIFRQAGAELPGPTRMLVAAGDTLRADGWWMMLGLLGALALAVRLLHDPKTRLLFDRLVLSVPVIGTFIRRAQSARLTRALGTLLSNGVGVVPAMAIARGVMSNLVAANVVDEAATRLKAGSRLAAALAAGGFFPVQTTHLLQLGEETGSLGEMALRAADIHDEQVRESVQRMVALLVPAVTIVMGIIVAAIVGSLLVAMLSLDDLVQ